MKDNTNTFFPPIVSGKKEKKFCLPFLNYDNKDFPNDPVQKFPHLDDFVLKTCT